MILFAVCWPFVEGIRASRSIPRSVSFGFLTGGKWEANGTVNGTQMGAKNRKMGAKWDKWELLTESWSQKIGCKIFFVKCWSEYEWKPISDYIIRFLSTRGTEYSKNSPSSLNNQARFIQLSDFVQFCTNLYVTPLLRFFERRV